MNQNRTILSLKQPCDEAVQNFVERMEQTGLQVMRTFDLHQTRMVETACSCPHHGTEKCDCQMVVLMVYGKGDQPVSLVAHGHDGQTWFSLVEFLGATNTRLENQISDIFTATPIDSDAGDLL